MLKRILVPLDGSELADRILVHVERLLCRADAEVVLLQVLPRAVEEPVDAARSRLEALRDRLIESGAQATARVVVGDPAARILEIAGEVEPDLIAMSTHGRSGLSRFVRGSVAERVLRNAEYPLLLANPQSLSRTETLRIKKILVPLDGSESSAEALPLAVDVARLFESEIVLMKSREIIASPDPLVGMAPVLVQEKAEAESELQELARRVSGVRVRTRVETGPASTSILDVARAERADLVAMTTHGRSGISRWAFGSVAEHVLRNCVCPMLVKRTAGFVNELVGGAASASRTPATSGLEEV